MTKKVLLRLLIWLVLMGYILLDFFAFKGPIYSKLKPEKSVIPDTERGIAARVFNKPIYLSQVDYAVDKLLWARGRKRSDVSHDELIYLRQVAMRDLADQYILREKLREQKEEYPVSEEAISAGVKRFAARFRNKGEMVDFLKQNGIQGDKELQYRIAAKLQQDQYITEFIKAAPDAIQQEAVKVYREYKDEYALPERVKVQHIFCARLENSEQQAMVKLNLAKATLDLSGQSQSLFAELSKALSEDERTRLRGGELGWIRKNRIAPDFTQAVFQAKEGVSQIIETKLGWHLILVTDRKEKQQRSFAELKPEIIQSLENNQRRGNVEKFRIALRRQHADRIKIDWKMLHRPWTSNLEKSEQLKQAQTF